jgi:hypothetical protein
LPHLTPPPPSSPFPSLKVSCPHHFLLQWHLHGLLIFNLLFLFKFSHCLFPPSSLNHPLLSSSYLD